MVREEEKTKEGRERKDGEVITLFTITMKESVISAAITYRERKRKRKRERKKEEEFPWC